MELTCPPGAPPANPAAAAKPSALLRWLIPDLALLASIVTLVFCLVFYDGTIHLFRDSDAGWHIRNGERIVSGGGLPRTDSWSMTRQGQPWFAWEWGADVIGGFLHQRGGLAYVATFYALVIAAATWFWFRLHWAVGGHFLIAGLMSTLLLTTGNIHWLARPHILSWVLILGALLMVETGRRSVAGLAVISVVWTNLHASFFLLPVVLVIYAFDRGLRSVLWSGFDRKADWKDSRWFVIAAVVCFAASFVNPYGWAVHEHILHYLGDRELLDRIGEFQSFNFRVIGAQQILATVLLTAVGGVLALTQKRLAHFFVVCAVRGEGARIGSGASAARDGLSAAREWRDGGGASELRRVSAVAAPARGRLRGVRSEPPQAGPELPWRGSGAGHRGDCVLGSESAGGSGAGWFSGEHLSGEGLQRARGQTAAGCEAAGSGLVWRVSDLPLQRGKESVVRRA